MKAKKDVTTPPPESFIKRLRLKTVGDIYDAMAKLTRLSAQGKISTDRYRSTIYGLHLLINALKERRSEEEPERGSGEQPLAYVSSFTDDTQRFLFEFYNGYWWVAHIMDHPREQSEAWNSYLIRLKGEVGHVSDWEHIGGLKFEPLGGAEEFERLHKALLSEGIGPDTE